MSATGRTLTLLLLASLAWSSGYAQSAGADYHPAVASAPAIIQV